MSLGVGGREVVEDWVRRFGRARPRLGVDANEVEEESERLITVGGPSESSSISYESPITEFSTRLAN